MRLSWKCEFSGDEGLRAQWDALVLESGRPEVFLTWEWAAAVARAYAISLPPWIGTAYEGDELVGIAALAKASPTEAVFLAGSTADYCDFISRPEIRAEFVSQVLDSLKQNGIRTIVLPNLPADSASIVPLRESKSFRSFLRIGYECAQVRLGSSEERVSLSRHVLRKSMFRRAMTALERLGPVSLRHQRGERLHDGIVDAFVSAHVARFLATGRLGNLVMKERRHFLAELARLMMERGWFDLMTLSVGDRAIGFNYGFRYQGNWSWYQPTIVNEFADYSPGFCLLTKIVEDACKDPEAQVVDLGLGDEGYKERFANTQRTTLHVTLSSSVVDQLKVRARYLAAEAVKSKPKVESLVRKAQRGIARARSRSAEGAELSTLTSIATRLRRLPVSRAEVWLYQWAAGAADAGTITPLIPVTWETLSAAAIKYSEDRATLEHLLRSAERLRDRKYRGYALSGEDGIALHFAWVAPYEGFTISQLGEVLPAPSPESVIIFDCWGPGDAVGQVQFESTIRNLGSCLSGEGKDVWTFSPADPVSQAAIENSGFCRQSTLVKKRVLFWSSTTQQPVDPSRRKHTEALTKGAVR